MRNKLFYSIICLIFIIAFITRFYSLGEIPLGLQQDETSIGYNAYSILQTGKDEYGISYPLYFKAFGEYKLPVYIYLTALSIKFFGVSAFAVRLPSAFFGLLTVIILYFLVKNLSKNNKTLALIATGLIAVNPWHLHFSRGAFEVTVALFFITVGTFLFYSSLHGEKRRLLLLGSVFCFAVSLYTYNIARIFSPLFLFSLFVLNWNQVRSHKKSVSYSIILGTVLLMPFLLNFFSESSLPSASGTLIFSSAVVHAPLLEMRSYLLHLPSLFTKLFFNFWISVFWQFIQNLISYFSVSFFFISGSQHGNHGIGNAGQFYIIEILFIVFGLWFSLKEKIKWVYVLILWSILVVVVASLTREAPHATRSFFLIVPLEVISCIGCYYLFKFIKGQRVYLKYLFIIPVFLFVGYNIVYYFTSYYVRFPVAYAKAWREEDKNISNYLQQEEKKYSKIIIDKDAGFMYTSLLFYNAYSPSDFQNSAMREKDDSEGFSQVKSFGKYEIKNIDWQNDYSRDVLIVTSKENKPKEIQEDIIFYYPVRPVVLALKQSLVRFPVQDIAYVAVHKK